MGSFRRRRRRVAAQSRTVVIGVGGWFFTSSEDLVIVPRTVVVFEGSIERGDFSVNDKLRDDVLFPISMAGVDPLGSEMTKVDGILVVNTER
jgi:hypothetical protein